MFYFNTKGITGGKKEGICVYSKLSYLFLWPFTRKPGFYFIRQVF